MQDTKSLTPLMRQYFQIRATYPEAILLFQVGDFYELFFQDAVRAAPILGVALTQRGTHNGEPIALCGVPIHVLEHYIAKLVKAGCTVAIADQLEVPRPGKIVNRGVTQVLTPGMLTDLKLLDAKSASYLCAHVFTGAKGRGYTGVLVFVELLTGQLYITRSSTVSTIESELCRFMPDEILLEKGAQTEAVGVDLKRQGYTITYESAAIDSGARHWFMAQFGIEQARLLESELIYKAVCLLYTYIARNNESALTHITQLNYYVPEEFLCIDPATQRNLELVKNAQDGSASGTVFSVLDRALTAMGSRMLKKWLLRPLMSKEQIEFRLDCISLLVADTKLKSDISSCLQSIADLERIVGRISLGRAQPYDYSALAKSLDVLPQLQKIVSVEHPAQEHLLTVLGDADCSALSEFMQSALSTDSSCVIKQGYDEELDRLRELASKGTRAVLELEDAEQQRTGIQSLKIKFNQVHGYGIEITQANAHLVPAQYIRVQTLANRERFTSQELKNLEHTLTHAKALAEQKERELYEAVKVQISSYVPLLKRVAQGLAQLDALVSLAIVAYEHKYVRPVFSGAQDLVIQQGRHPVIEQRVQSFIANDVCLTQESLLWIITGPNMGGKSTFLRQVALQVLLAHMGSFVPAAKATIPLVDRIFTRIGASDNVAAGKSTFLVEMEETAVICQQATASSLIILDEVGRGTSTFDGLAIAQAVVEYLYTRVKAKCLFATHYHELTHLAERFEPIKTYYMASRKVDDRIVLLHKIVQGVADGSFGLEVAALAQLPPSIVGRAREIVKELSHTPLLPATIVQSVPQGAAEQHRVYTEVKELDIDQLTARQALEVLWKLKELL